MNRNMLQTIFFGTKKTITFTTTILILKNYEYSNKSEVYQGPRMGSY